MAFPLSNETEVEENQEEDGMDDGSDAADARRLDKTRAEDRHRNPVEVQIEKNSGVHKEGACKKLGNVLPWNPSKHVRFPFFRTTTVRFDFKSLSSCVTPSSSRNATNFCPRAQRKEKQNDESTKAPARQGHNRRGEKACAARAAQG